MYLIIPLLFNETNTMASIIYLLLMLRTGDGTNAVLDYSKYPFLLKPLRVIGFTTPWEQYAFYGSFGTAVFASFQPLRKGYYLNKWMNEQDEILKVIWAGKGKLLDSEMQAGKAYLTILRQTPRTWALLPISFCLFEGLKLGYRKFLKKP
jgi:hypothetical protein